MYHSAEKQSANGIMNALKCKKFVLSSSRKVKIHDMLKSDISFLVVIP